jgi:hypothetical protein
MGMLSEQEWPETLPSVGRPLAPTSSRYRIKLREMHEAGGPIDSDPESCHREVKHLAKLIGYPRIDPAGGNYIIEEICLLASMVIEEAHLISPQQSEQEAREGDHLPGVPPLGAPPARTPVQNLCGESNDQGGAMEQPIGTCSICGGGVRLSYHSRGRWIHVCEQCDAIGAEGLVLRFPFIRMVPRAVPIPSSPFLGTSSIENRDDVPVGYAQPTMTDASGRQLPSEDPRASLFGQKWQGGESVYASPSAENDAARANLDEYMDRVREANDPAKSEYQRGFEAGLRSSANEHRWASAHRAKP